MRIYSCSLGGIAFPRQYLLLYTLYKKQNQSVKQINTALFSGSTTSLIINILLILVWSWEADTAATQLV